VAASFRDPRVPTSGFESLCGPVRAVLRCSPEPCRSHLRWHRHQRCYPEKAGAETILLNGTPHDPLQGKNTCFAGRAVFRGPNSMPENRPNQPETRCIPEADPSCPPQISINSEICKDYCKGGCQMGAPGGKRLKYEYYARRKELSPKFYRVTSTWRSAGYSVP
jgi:hypothetical protein